MKPDKKYEPQPISQERADEFIRRAVEQGRRNVRITEGQRKTLRETKRS